MTVAGDTPSEGQSSNANPATPSCVPLGMSPYLSVLPLCLLENGDSDSEEEINQCL